MSMFNEKQMEAMFGGNYICSKCGGKMEFEDKWEETLVCPACGHDVAVERYGMENDEEYEAQYPTREEVVGYEDDKDEDDYCGETYDEVCGELDDYVP